MQLLYGSVILRITSEYAIIGHDIVQVSLLCLLLQLHFFDALESRADHGLANLVRRLENVLYIVLIDLGILASRRAVIVEIRVTRLALYCL